MFVFKILSDKSILKVVLYLRLNSGFVFLIKVFSYRSGSDCHLSPAAPAYFSVTSKFSKSLPFSLNLNKNKKNILCGELLLANDADYLLGSSGSPDVGNCSHGLLLYLH